MAYQDDVFQTGASERAFEAALTDTLTLDAAGDFSPSRFVEATEELTLSASAEIDLGGPSTVFLRLRVFMRHPGRFSGLPPLTGGNEVLAEPVLFFHKDSQVNLDFTLLNPDGTKYNLTGSTVDLLAQPERGAALTFSCSVIDAVNGLCRRVVAVGDFAAGPYQAQIRVTNGPAVFHTVYFRILIGKAIE